VDITIHTLEMHRITRFVDMAIVIATAQNRYM